MASEVEGEGGEYERRRPELTVSLTAEALVKRLVALVPPARLHLTSSHGVHAANARLRPVVLQPEPEPATTPPLKEDAPQKAKPTRPPRLDWATLQAKTLARMCGSARGAVATDGWWAW